MFGQSIYTRISLAESLPVTVQYTASGDRGPVYIPVTQQESRVLRLRSHEYRCVSRLEYGVSAYPFTSYVDSNILRVKLRSEKGTVKCHMSLERVLVMIGAVGAFL